MAEFFRKVGLDDVVEAVGGECLLLDANARADQLPGCGDRVRKDSRLVPPEGAGEVLMTRNTALLIVNMQLSVYASSP